MAAPLAPAVAHPTPHLPRPVALVAAVGSGALVAVQSRINGGLGHAVGDGLVAALIAFLVGLAVLGVAVVVAAPRRRATAALPGLVRAGRLRWWQLLGGLGGATLVAAQGITVPTLGVALFSVAALAGQTVNSLAVDHVGLGPSGAHDITAPRAVSALLAVGAVALAVSGRLGQATFSVPFVVLALVAGCLVAMQQAVNGQVATATGQPVVATFGNFTAGTIALAVAVTVKAATGGLPALHLPGPADWWLYLGGPMGVVFVLVAAVIVRVLGVLLLSLGVVSGQLAGALALDLIVPAHGQRPGLATVLGVLLTFVAVLVTVAPGLRARRATRRRAARGA